MDEQDWKQYLSGEDLEKSITFLDGGKEHFLIYKKLEELSHEFKRRNIELGEGVVLGNDCYLYRNIRLGDYTCIGEGTKIGSYVCIERNCRIGNHCQIYSGAVIKEQSCIDNGTLVKVGSINS